MIINNNNNNNKGSITVLALLIMSVIMILSIYLIYITKLQSLISVSSKNKIQSYYLAESKINRVFYEDKYYLNYIYPVIKDKLQNSSIPSYKIYIDNFDMDEDDEENTVACRFTNYSSNAGRNLVLETKSIHNGIETSLIAYGPIAADLYELENSVIDSAIYPDLTNLLKDIKDNISTSEFPSGTNYKLVKTFHNDKIIITDNKKVKLFSNSYEVNEEQLKDRNFLIFENQLNIPINLHIGDIENSNVITLEGLVYIDGDIHINSNLKFRGILLVNGNIYINPNIVNNSEIKGIVLTNGSIDYNSFVIYDRSYIYRYGVYLPGFIQPRLEVYKKL